jgi:hypothetical protein
MNDNKNQQEKTPGTGEQNPTLDSPGSQVADYGNPTGGSANETAGQGQQGSNPQRGNSDAATEQNGTIGNP